MSRSNTSSLEEKKRKEEKYKKKASFESNLIGTERKEKCIWVVSSQIHLYDSFCSLIKQITKHCSLD